MAEVKKWNVTYTKHIKQKRKVYQDGRLELHSPIHKVTLYDDCEKLLESRLVKKDDVIDSGETLTFNAYLVDIGDPEGDHKPIANLDVQGRDKKITKKAGPLHGQMFRTNSTSFEDRKPDLRKKIAPSTNLSPSQKIIREFKKSEANKFGTPLSSPDTAKSSTTDWQVLYTTQVTQKAKKYHDGILRVATCGSYGRQVTLYDLSRRLLDNRFLKKDEVVATGESLAFGGHLVDIGEPEGDHNAQIELNVQQTNGNAVGGTTLLHQRQAQSKSSVEPEGDHKAQIDLNVQGRSCNAVGRTGLLHQKMAQYNSSVGEPHKSARSGNNVVSNCSGSDVDNFKLSRRVPVNKPLRDAHGILSILRKPITLEGMVPTESAPVEPWHASPSSDFNHCDLQNQISRQAEEVSDFKRSWLDERGNATTRKHHCSGDTSKSKAVPDDLSPETNTFIDMENERELQPKSSTSSSFSLSSEAPNTFIPKTDVECPERNVTRTVSSIDEPQSLRTVESDFYDNSRTPSVSLPHDRSIRSAKIGDSLELRSPGETSSGSQMEMENSHQPNAGNIEMSTKLAEGAFDSGLAMSSVGNSYNVGDAERESSKEHKNTIKNDECPSFDLGF